MSPPPLPEEMAAMIVASVHDPSDLVPLAQTNRQYLRLCKPRLDFERLAVRDLDEPRLWEQLARHPADARVVRVLFVGFEPPPPDWALPRLLARTPAPAAQPDGLVPAQVLEQQILQICAALANMRGLQTFVWSIDGRLQGDVRCIWRTLRDSCPHLLRLHVLEATPRGPAPVRLYTFLETELLNLRNLDSVALQFACAEAPSASSVCTALKGFFTHSPRIQRLSLAWALPGFIYASFDELLPFVNLPLLRRLMLVRVSASSLVVRDFFRRHVLIEELSIDDGMDPDFFDLAGLEDGDLPNMAVLEIGHYYLWRVALAAFLKTKSPIRELRSFTLDDFYPTWEDEDASNQTRQDLNLVIACLRTWETTLQTIRLARFEEEEDEEALNWLHWAAPGVQITLKNGQSFTFVDDAATTSGPSSLNELD